MPATALKRQRQPQLKTYHATVLVTRAEEWCVDAHSEEEARELLASGEGHRCHLGDRIHLELQDILGG
jgi:hypothetical protein